LLAGDADLQRCDVMRLKKKRKKVENWADDLSIAIVCHRENHLQFCHCHGRGVAIQMTPILSRIVFYCMVVGILFLVDDTLQILLPVALAAGMHVKVAYGVGGCFLFLFFFSIVKLNKRNMKSPGRSPALYFLRWRRDQ
jgi:ABC-type uncharacterized transport system permease subunit